MKKRSTKDVLEMIDHQIGADKELREMVEMETVNACVAQLIYDARTAAGLSQRELAKLIGTSQSTIVRLEDSDYEGHSLTMLIRIAAALGKHVDISLIDGAANTGMCCQMERSRRTQKRVTAPA